MTTTADVASVPTKLSTQNKKTKVKLPSTKLIKIKDLFLRKD